MMYEKVNRRGRRRVTRAGYVSYQVPFGILGETQLLALLQRPVDSLNLWKAET